MDVRLILKGGGCENMSAQYSLPATLDGKRADRDLEGVRACILDAVWQAQGKGCGPGFLGVCIGGDRASGYEYAKEQLLRDAGRHQPRSRSWPRWKPASWTRRTSSTSARWASAAS